MDLVVSDQGTHVDAVPGGGPANAARALALAGASSAFFGGFSDDAFGGAQRRWLEESGVDCSPSVQSVLPSALAVAETQGEHTRYGFHLTGTASFSVAPDDVPLVDGRGDPFTAVHIGGLGTAIPPFADTLRNRVQDWRGQRTIISYDPNIRQGFEQLGQDKDSVEAWVRVSDIVKVSVEDLQLLYPNRDPQLVTYDWLGLGPSLIVVTDGPRSVLARNTQVTAETTPPALPPGVSPIGAGDAFSAGLLMSLHEIGALASPERLAAAGHAQLFAALIAATGHVATTLTSTLNQNEGAQLRAS